MKPSRLMNPMTKTSSPNQNRIQFRRWRKLRKLPGTTYGQIESPLSSTVLHITWTTPRAHKATGPSSCSKERTVMTLYVRQSLK